MNKVREGAAGQLFNLVPKHFGNFGFCRAYLYAYVMDMEKKWTFMWEYMVWRQQLKGPQHINLASRHYHY